MKCKFCEADVELIKPADADNALPFYVCKRCGLSANSADQSGEPITQFCSVCWNKPCTCNPVQTKFKQVTTLTPPSPDTGDGLEQTIQYISEHNLYLQHGPDFVSAIETLIHVAKQSQQLPALKAEVEELKQRIEMFKRHQL